MEVILTTGQMAELTTAMALLVDWLRALAILLFACIFLQGASLVSRGGSS